MCKKANRKFINVCIFPRKQVFTFHANCLHWRHFARNLRTCFLEKKLAQRVVMVKWSLYFRFIQHFPDWRFLWEHGVYEDSTNHKQVSKRRCIQLLLQPYKRQVVTPLFVVLGSFFKLIKAFYWWLREGGGMGNHCIFCTVINSQTDKLNFLMQQVKFAADDMLFFFIENVLKFHVNHLSIFS